MVSDIPRKNGNGMRAPDLAWGQGQVRQKHAVVKAEGGRVNGSEREGEVYSLKGDAMSGV